jgi:hypothetical protein
MAEKTFVIRYVLFISDFTLIKSTLRAGLSPAFSLPPTPGRVIPSSARQKAEPGSGTDSFCPLCLYHYTDHLNNLRLSFRESKAITYKSHYKNDGCLISARLSYHAIRCQTKKSPWKTIQVKAQDVVTAEVCA